MADILTVLNPVTAVAASGAAQALAASSSIDPVYDITLTANCVLTLAASAVSRAQTVTVILRQDATAGRVASLPDNVAWPNSYPPSLNSAFGKIDILQFVTYDAGATWIGVALTLGASVASISLSAFTANVQSGSTFTAQGGYVGKTPTNIEYRVDGGSWTPASGATISNGSYSFTASAPAVGMHTLQVREANATTVVSSVQGFTVVAAAAASARYYNSALISGAESNAKTTGKTTAWDHNFLDCRVHVNLDSYTGTAGLIQEWGTGAANNSNFIFWINGGKLSFTFVNGASGTVSEVKSGPDVATAIGTVPAGGVYLRGVINQNTGVVTGSTGMAVSGVAAKFFYSFNGTDWTQIGNDVATGAPSGIQPNTSPAPTIGNGPAAPGHGKFYSAQVYNAAALQYNPDFKAQAAGTTSFADTSGNTWTVTAPGVS